MKQKSEKLVLVIVLIATMSFFSAVALGHTKDSLSLDVAMDRSVLPAETTQKAYICVSLTGLEFTGDSQRAPVNVALVIDKSGSMSGQKIAKAKQAAIVAIDRLNANDIVSVVTYDTDVKVVVPATKVSDRTAIFDKIRSIRADGSTALYAGVAKGAEEIRKFLDENRVNRLILLSDGLANVGPQRPDDLGRLGKRLIKDGISVSTIGLGLGYNEDLMTQLAYKSDGCHYFVEKVNDLCRIFDQELGKVLTAVAQHIEIEIRCESGIRPVRVLGREARIDGQKVKLFINQLYSEREKYAILEVEIPARQKDTGRKIASVAVNYHNLNTQNSDVLKSSLRGSFSSSANEVQRSINNDVMVKVIEQIATERNELAVTLRDAGKMEEARKTLMDNSGYLMMGAEKYKCPALKELGILNEQQARGLAPKDWRGSRCGMRAMQSRSRQRE